MIYEGQVNIPNEQLSEFKAALFDLKFDKLNDQDSEEESEDTLSNNGDVPKKVTKMEVESQMSSEPSPTPKKTVVKDEVDKKPILPMQSGNFLENVFQKSKETLIPDFSNNSPNTSQSSITTPTFKPTFVPPPLNVAAPKQNLTMGILSLYWVKYSHTNVNKSNAPADCNHFLICMNGNEAFVSFQTEIEASKFVKSHKAKPIQELPLNQLLNSDRQLIEKELSARPRIHVCIGNLPNWNTKQVVRMLKSHGIPVRKDEVLYDQLNRRVNLQIPDPLLVKKIEKSFHGQYQDGYPLSVEIL